MNTNLALVLTLGAELLTANLASIKVVPDRTVMVSNVLYTIQYKIKSATYFVPLTNPLGQPHFDCTAIVLRGTNVIGELETQWTENGCFEDNPMLLLGRVLNWKRYPNNSAGTNMHWVVNGAAMRAEPD